MVVGALAWPSKNASPGTSAEMTPDRDRYPLIVAHRGASAVAPENTLAAFSEAVTVGAEGIEFDVRLAGDGVPVVIHDETLFRTGGKPLRIADVSSVELSNMNVGSWFNLAHPAKAKARFAAQTVPTLAETLAFLKDFRGRIYIELKCTEYDAAGLTETVAREINNSSLLERVIVKSFELAVIPQIRRLCPEARTAALFAPKIISMLRKEKYVVSIAEEFGADELSLHYSLATHALMKKAGERGMPVTIWTADHPAWISRGLKLGLRAIITNNPARLLRRRINATPSVRRLS